MGFGPPARNRKEIALEIAPKIGPAEKIGNKIAHNGDNLISSPFFPYFLGAANFGSNLGSYFFPISGRRPETHFLPRSARS